MIQTVFIKRHFFLIVYFYDFEFALLLSIEFKLSKLFIFFFTESRGSGKYIPVFVSLEFLKDISDQIFSTELKLFENKRLYSRFELVIVIAQTALLTITPRLKINKLKYLLEKYWNFLI